MEELAKIPCRPAEGRASPLEDVRELLGRLEGWDLDSQGHLYKDYAFADFAQGLGFVNAIGALADEVDHHPDLLLRWGGVRVTIWTHSIGALSVGDFAFAARVELRYRAMAGG